MSIWMCCQQRVTPQAAEVDILYDKINEYKYFTNLQ